MTKQQKFKEWLDSCSFREATLVVDLLASGYILYLYIKAVMFASAEQLADINWVSGLLMQVVIYSIVLMIASYIVLALVSDKELEQPLDVREKQINLIGYKYSAWILQVGVVFAIFQYQIEAQAWFGFEHAIPFMPLHIMLVAFILSEVVNYAAQLYKGRTGDIYE